MDRKAQTLGYDLRLIGGEGWMAGEAAESLAAAGDVTQHIVRTVLELEVQAGQEGARCLAEQYRTDVELIREIQAAAVHWQTMWPEMLRDPMRWSLHMLEQNVELAQKCVGAMRQNAEAVTQCLRRMETSTEDATHAMQKARGR